MLPYIHSLVKDLKGKELSVWILSGLENHVYYEP